MKAQIRKKREGKNPRIQTQGLARKKGDPLTGTLITWGREKNRLNRERYLLGEAARREKTPQRRKRVLRAYQERKRDKTAYCSTNQKVVRCLAGPEGHEKEKRGGRAYA